VLQAWDFRAGGDFLHDMQQAVIQCERTLIVLSPHYLSSVFAEAEWRAVFAQDPAGTKGLLVPVRVEDCDPTPLGLLRTRTHIDLVGLDSEEAARRRLVERVQSERAKPTVAPGFPGKRDRSLAEQPVFPGISKVGGLLPQRPVARRVTDLKERQQAFVPLDAICVDGNRRCFTRESAECLSDDTERSDVIRLGKVGQGRDLVLYLHTMRQEHRWEMDQGVGVGVQGFMPITFVNKEMMRAFPPNWDAFLQEVMPARYLRFTAADLISMLDAGPYSVSPEDVLVTGQYQDEERYWVHREAQCVAGHEREIRLSKGTHNGPGRLTVSVDHLREHASRLQKKEAVTGEVERNYLELCSLPVIY
jgi:hypothetical protein